MIEAIVEHIDRPTVIVRAGERTSEHGRPYVRSIFGEKVSRGWVELKGYDRGVHPALFSAVMRSLFRDGFRVAQFDRLKGRPRTIFLTLSRDGVAHMEVVFHHKKH